MKKIIHPLEPIYDSKSKILILGSFPSVLSRQKNFYYANYQNRFWKIIASLYNEENPLTKEDKTKLLLNHDIALWDVIHSCTIEGSSDSSISNVKVNDLNIILKNSDVKTIYVNGKTALKYYNKYIYPKTNINAIYLPSTSSANASYSLTKLIEEYKIILENED